MPLTILFSCLTAGFGIAFWRQRRRKRAVESRLRLASRGIRSTPL